MRSVPPCLRLQRYIGFGRFTSIATTFFNIKRNFSFLSLYIYCAHDSFSGYPRQKHSFRGGLGWRKEEKVFVPFEAVLLNLTMKYNSCHQRSLLLSSMKYYSCFYTTFLGVCQSNSSPYHFQPPIPCGDRSYLACRQTFSLPAPN